MKIKIFFILGLFIFVSAFYARALDFAGDIDQFVRENPDGKKYEFFKYYINAMAFIQKYDNSRKTFADLKADNRKEERKKIKEYMDTLKKTNFDLRMAKNSVDQFFRPYNGLMLKAVDLFSKVCEDFINNNNEEYRLMSGWFKAQQAEDLSNFSGEEFSSKMDEITSSRRDIYQRLYEASSLAAKVLISNKLDRFGQLYAIGITKREKERLLEIISYFEGWDFEGDLRAGQTFFGASIAVLKDALEDKTWVVLER